jgi:hypothetical protein
VSLINIPINDENDDLPALPKLEGKWYSESYIVGSSICSTIELSVIMNKHFVYSERGIPVILW